MKDQWVICVEAVTNSNRLILQRSHWPLMIGCSCSQIMCIRKKVSSMVECKARSAYLIGLAFNGNYALEDTSALHGLHSKGRRAFCHIAGSDPAQLLGYYLSVARGIGCVISRYELSTVYIETGTEHDDKPKCHQYQDKHKKGHIWLALLLFSSSDTP